VAAQLGRHAARDHWEVESDAEGSNGEPHHYDDTGPLSVRRHGHLTSWNVVSSYW
jgi:hypothetical protein